MSAEDDRRRRRRRRAARPRPAARKRIKTKRGNQLARERLAARARLLFVLYTTIWPEEHHHMVRGQIAAELHVSYSTVCSYLREDRRRRPVGRRARGRGWTEGEIRAAKRYWRERYGLRARPIDWNPADLRRLKDPVERELRLERLREGWIDDEGNRRRYPNAKTAFGRRLSQRHRRPPRRR